MLTRPTAYTSLTMLPALGFGLHIATTHENSSQLLNAETAFPALTLFQIVSSGIQEAATHIMGLLVAYGSLQRVDEFLVSNTWHDTRTLLKGVSSSNFSPADATSMKKRDGDLAVKLDSVGAGWASEGELVIKEATLEVPLRGLTVIAGPSGSGKSTLLRLILGDVSPATGTVSVRSRHNGFCDQTP